MQKTMITAATVFALVMSAGASMAGPLNGNGFGGKAHDVRSAVSQAFDHQTDHGFDLSQNNLSSTQPQSTYGTNWSSELPNVVVIDIHDGANSSLIIGKADDMIGEYSWMFGRFGLDAR